MTIAAAPLYLGQSHADASPAQRFGSLLPVWEKGSWEKSKDKQVWKSICALNADDRQRMDALAQRQRMLGTLHAGAVLTLHAEATAPFATGLGNAHPLENGFAFLNPYGLPYLPGSGIKGVLRQAARELAEAMFGGTDGWDTDIIDVLFGLEAKDDEPHRRGVLCFWDALPQLPEKLRSLKVEIMTAHQSHYLQGKESPHDSGTPNPICFLSLPPGTHFVFQVSCDRPFLQRIAASADSAVAAAAARLLDQDHWRDLLQAAFTHAFDWLGFGAKTAVGYGAMRLDAEGAQRADAERAAAEQADRERREAAEREAARASMSAAALAIDDFVGYMSGQAELLRGGKGKLNGPEHNRARELARMAHGSSEWTAAERALAAQAIEEWLPKLVPIELKAERKKLKLGALKGADG